MRMQLRTSRPWIVPALAILLAGAALSQPAQDRSVSVDQERRAARTAVSDDPIRIVEPPEPDAVPDSFFEQFVLRGGGIVYYVLIPMSIIAVCRILELAVTIRRRALVPPNIASDIATAAQHVGWGKLAPRIAGGRDLVSRSMHRALVQARRTGDRRYMQHVAIEGLHDQAMRLFRKVELCNIIGNVAPMVGLFGTVYGMIQAFGLLGVSGGQPRHDQLAEKISIALVTTFWGLLIAIPALTMYGIFRTRIEAIVSEAALEIEALLHQVRLPAPERPAPKPAAAPDDSARTKKAT